jgi:hypothetical protein
MEKKKKENTKNIIIIILVIIILLLLKGCDELGISGAYGGGGSSGGGNGCPACDCSNPNTCQAPTGYYSVSGVTTAYPILQSDGSSCQEKAGSGCNAKGLTVDTYQLTGTCCIYSCKAGVMPTPTTYVPSEACDDRGYGCVDAKSTYYNYCVGQYDLMEYTCNQNFVCTPNQIRCSTLDPNAVCVDHGTNQMYCGVLPT